VRPPVPVGTGRNARTVVRGHIVTSGRDRVPPRAAVAHDVERLELARQIERFVERSGTSRHHPNPLGAARNRGQRHHHVEIEAGRLIFDLSGHGTGIVGQEQELQLTALSRLRLPHLGVEAGIANGIDAGHTPRAGQRAVAIAQVHADDHLVLCL
jgi:hypothetical protein